MSAAARTTARWAIALLLAFTTEATASGLNLAWDDCGAGGPCNKDFACNTNIGAPFALVASFVPPEGTTKITGEEISIEICSNGGYMPPWWSYRNAGSCRTSAMQASIDAASASLTRCEDYWSFAGAGGIASYDPMYRGGGDRAIIRLVFAVPTTVAGPVDPAREYYACIVRFTRDLTVGTGSCAGCSMPMGFATAGSATEAARGGRGLPSDDAGHPDTRLRLEHRDVAARQLSPLEHPAALGLPGRGPDTPLHLGRDQVPLSIGEIPCDLLPLLCS